MNDTTCLAGSIHEWVCVRASPSWIGWISRCCYSYVLIKWPLFDSKQSLLFVFLLSSPLSGPLAPWLPGSSRLKKMQEKVYRK